MKEQEAKEGKSLSEMLRRGRDQKVFEVTQPKLFAAKLSKLERALLKHDVRPNMSGGN
jgi:hypothetical protein